MARYQNLERVRVGSLYRWVGYAKALGGRAVRVTKDRSTGYWNATVSAAGPSHGTFVCRAATLAAMDRKLGGN